MTANEPPSPAVIEVAAGLVRNSAGQYLIARRRPGAHLAGLWEFPGGKRHPGESLEDCLRRELREELGAVFAVGDRVETVRWDYPEHTVVVHFFRCRLQSGALAPREGQELAWVAPERFADYDFPAADAALITRLASSSGRAPTAEKSDEANQ